MFIIDYLLRLRSILFEPIKFAEDTESEEGMLWPFIFMLVSFGIVLLLSSAPRVISADLSLSSFIDFVKVLALYPSLILSVTSVMFHFLVKIQISGVPFYQTFKAFAYISPLVVIWFIITAFYTFFSIVVLIWMFVLMIILLKHYTGLSRQKLIRLIILLFALLITLLVVVVALLVVDFGFFF